MRFLHLFFMFFYISAARSLRRKESFMSILNKSNNYGVNRPVPIERLINDPINKITQNINRRKFYSTGQMKDGRHYLGWLPWLANIYNKHGKKSDPKDNTDELGRESNKSRVIIKRRQHLDKDWVKKKQTANKMNMKASVNNNITTASGSKKSYLGWSPWLTRRYHKKNRRLEPKSFRHRRKYTDESGRSSSTSNEMAKWKLKFDEDWIREKQKAIKEKMKTPAGAIVNMAAARPWSSSCGDPQQHDVPWGTCTLSFQCLPELRIYRGDFQCGKTKFVCCALLTTHHDMFQGLDMSFIDTDSSSSGEKGKQLVRSAQRRHDKRRREKIRRWNRRNRSKKKIKIMIERLAHEITKNLFRALRNNSVETKIKMKEMTKAIKLLKRKYRNERLKIRIKLDDDILDSHKKLDEKLVNMNIMNKQYLTNETFRELLKKYNLTVASINTIRSMPAQLRDFLFPNTKATRSNAEQTNNDLRKFNDKPPEPGEYSMNESEPPVNLTRASNDSLVETAENFKIEEPLQGEQIQDTLNRGSSESLNYNLENIKSLEAMPLDTRRFGVDILGKQKVHGKNRDLEDYLDYDIEYGALYY